MHTASSQFTSGLLAAVIDLVVIVLLGGAMTFALRWVGAKVAYANAQKQTTVITTAVSTAVDGLQLTILERMTAQDGPLADVIIAVDAVGTRLQRLESDQFGSNHGGMREALNTNTSMVVEQGKTLARIQGQLEEHLRANAG